MRPDRRHVTPMLAAPARELPVGEGWTYEPRWDAFRCVAFARGGAVDLRSRHGKPLARYLPEVVAAVAALPRDCVLDGALLVRAGGRPDFPALMARLHLADPPVGGPPRETAAAYVAFDLLAEGGEDLADRPFAERRARLLRLVEGSGVEATPSTTDPARAAAWLAAPPGDAIDGVVAKPAGLTYQPGKRAMVKVERERRADCVVAGMRVDEGPLLSALLLGLWDGPALVHVGTVRAFAASERARLAGQLAPYVAPPAGHPWEHGFAFGWTPLRPVLVAEVAYSRVDGVRFRHAARLVRWRPDREAASCDVTQVR